MVESRDDRGDQFSSPAAEDSGVPGLRSDCDSVPVDPQANADDAALSDRTIHGRFSSAVGWVRGKLPFRKDGRSDAFHSPPLEIPSTSTIAPDLSKEPRAVRCWLDRLFSPRSLTGTGETGGRADGVTDSADCAASSMIAGAPAETDVASLKGRVVDALISGIRCISSPSDRDRILGWFLNAREILGRDCPKTEIAKSLYTSVDTKSFAKLLGNTALTSLRNYKDSNLSLSLKIAIPVTVAGTALFGLQGAGLAIFGGAIGLPVVLVLFLGTAGVTSVVEAFVKDKTVRDPLTQLLLAMLVLETRRARGRNSSTHSAQRLRCLNGQQSPTIRMDYSRCSRAWTQWSLNAT